MPQAAESGAWRTFHRKAFLRLKPKKHKITEGNGKNGKGVAMYRGLYTAYTGMRVQQDVMNVVSNNLANIDTTGFKKDKLGIRSFKDVLAIKQNDPDLASRNRIGRMNLGVTSSVAYTSFEQGPLKNTERKTDIALEGKGMFVVGKRQADGTFKEYFTRDGGLAVNQLGQLMTKNGEYVLGENGIITAPHGRFHISQNGNVYSEQNELLDRIRLVSFTDFSELRKVGDNLYTATERAEQKAFDGVVEQGFLETSNVNTVQEMVEMISVMRAYESNQKVLTTFDSTMEKAANEVGRV